MLFSNRWSLFNPRVYTAAGSSWLDRLWLENGACFHSDTSPLIECWRRASFFISPWAAGAGPESPRRRLSGEVIRGRRTYTSLFVLFVGFTATVFDRSICLKTLMLRSGSDRLRHHHFEWRLRAMA